MRMETHDEWLRIPTPPPWSSVESLLARAAEGRFPFYVRDYATNQKWFICSPEVWERERRCILALVAESKDWRWSDSQMLMFA